MRRGCIAVGLIKCDLCSNIIEHGERYLILEEEPETKQRICLACCEQQNYGKYEIEKGEKIFTLLVDDEDRRLVKKKVDKPVVAMEIVKEDKIKQPEKKKAVSAKAKVSTKQISKKTKSAKK